MFKKSAHFVGSYCLLCDVKVTCSVELWYLV